MMFGREIVELAIYLSNFNSKDAFNISKIRSPYELHGKSDVEPWHLQLIL